MDNMTLRYDNIEKEFYLYQCRPTMYGGMNITENKVRQAIEQLTENQQDLVWEAYGMLRGDTEIAKEQNTSRQAIQNRRNKIKSRIEKLLMEL